MKKNYLVLFCLLFFGNSLFAHSLLLSFFSLSNLETHIPAEENSDSMGTDITITLSASSGSGWSISGGELTATASVTINYQVIEDALEAGDLVISSHRDIIFDATIAPALLGNRTLTLKAAKDIIMQANTAISATGFALNTILWSDADALDAGMVYLKTRAEILTNGGHLWIGGGNGNFAWNGLTVGNGNSIGNTTNSNGITLIKTNIRTGGGNIAFYGRGLPGAAAGTSVPISTENALNTDGIRLHDGNFIDAGSGSIYMYGSADNSHRSSNSNGVELSHTGGGDMITSSNSTADAIFIEGYAEGPAGVSNSWGFYTHVSTVQNTGGGTIHIKGSAVRNSGVTVAGNGAILANGGKIILEGTAAGGTDPGVLIQGAVGQKAGSAITSSEADIEIIGDRFSAPTGRIQSSGVLAIRPYTAGTEIGVGSAPGTLRLPASFFQTNFVNGFSGIIVGDENAGHIRIGGITIYQDPLTLKTDGNILFSNDAEVQSVAASALTLWTRAGGDNEANDLNYGMIWVPQGSSIHTGGGNLTMGGGSDPFIGYAMGDPSTGSAENNAVYRGVSMNGAVNAAGGTIVINGKAAIHNYVINARGVSLGGQVETRGAGNISVRGVGKGASDPIALGDTYFEPDAVGTLETGTGDITLEAKPIDRTSNGINVSTTGSYIKTDGNFWATTTGRITATAGALNIGGSTILEAVDNITLTHTSNDFGGPITVNGAANLQLTDRNELSLGDISISGTMEIASFDGDLTITGNISTTNATAAAIRVFADKTKAAGDLSGGNIKISGNRVISTGTGGRASLYSGSIVGSAALIALTGKENTRYEVDANTTLFDPGLGSGNYALIREKKALTQVSVFNYPGLNGNGGCDDENANLINIIDALPDYAVDPSITSFSNPSLLATQLDASTFFFMTDMEVGVADPNTPSFFPGASRGVIENWVKKGGVMVMTATSGRRDTDFLNLIFNWDLETVNSSYNSSWAKNTANTAGTPFEEVTAANLPYLSATDAIRKNSVPKFTTMWGTDDNAAVAVIEYGAGYVIFMGWDFYNAGPTCPEYSSAWVQQVVPAALEYAAELSQGGVRDISYTTADLLYSFSQTGESYYVVVANGSTAPTAEQIKAGSNYGGVTVVNANSATTTADTPHIFNMSNLAYNTAYDVYVVTEYANGSPAFSQISKFNFTTLAKAGIISNRMIFQRVQ